MVLHERVEKLGELVDIPEILSKLNLSYDFSVTRIRKYQIRFFLGLFNIFNFNNFNNTKVNFAMFKIFFD